MTYPAQTARRITAATLAALALTAPVAFTSGPAQAAGSVSTQAASQPRTPAGARAAAGVAFDDYAAGDYGPFWDQWSAASKKIVSRRDYVRRFRLCPPIAEGLRFKITKVVVNAAGTRARVRASRWDVLFTYDFVYEAGAWRYVLPADVARVYRTKTVTQIVKEDRAAGNCG